jgi:hypothetical protein
VGERAAGGRGGPAVVAMPLRHKPQAGGTLMGTVVAIKRLKTPAMGACQFPRAATCTMVCWVSAMVALDQGWVGFTEWAAG